MTLHQSKQIERAVDAINTHLVERKYPPLSGDVLDSIYNLDTHTEACWALDTLRTRVNVPHTLTGPLRSALVARFGSAPYIREFPDYGRLDFEVPPGFDDTSWHNDACPSWEGHDYKLFADYKNPEHREQQQKERFALVIGDSASRHWNHLVLAGDDFEREIAPFIAFTVRCAVPQRVRVGRLITRAKAEVVHDVLEGELPISLRSVVDLRVRGGVHTLNTLRDEVIAALVQRTIHSWLTSGGMRASVERLPRRQGIKERI